MAARKAQLISVVVPVYKNRETVGELAAQLCGVTPELELIFVNDACPVGTGDVLDRLAARYKWIRVIHHSTNLGQTAALLRGIEAASGEYIAILDADLQDPPEALPLLLAELERGDWGAVFAGRRGNYQNRSRMLTSKIFKGIVTRLADLPPDAAGFVVFLVKSSVLVCVQIWVRWTLPRLRIDQVMTTCLKYLIPISCVLFLGAVLYPLVLAKMVNRTTIIGEPPALRLLRPSGLRTQATISRPIANGVAVASEGSGQ